MTMCVIKNHTLMERMGTIEGRFAALEGRLTGLHEVDRTLKDYVDRLTGELKTSIATVNTDLDKLNGTSEKRFTDAFKNLHAHDSRLN